MILDAAKGYVPTLVAWYIFHTHDMQVAAGIAAVLGHDFPVYIGFRGGRGVPTSFGVYAALALPLAVGMVAVGIFIVLALRYMSVMSMVTVPGGAIVLLLLAVFHVDRRLHLHEDDLRRLRDVLRPAHAHPQHPPADQGHRAEDRRRAERPARAATPRTT